MTYDDIVAIFMATPETPFPQPTLPHTPARRLRDAVEPIATQGWWSRPAGERMTALGLGFFDGYVWGRAASMGEPTAALVVATFGVFESTMLSAVYDGAVGVASRADVLGAREAGAIDSLASLVSADDAARVAEPLLAALLSIDGLGRPLFSSLRALPMPASPHGRLWRAAELVREHRGDGHLAAVAAAGIDRPTINVLTELWLGFGPGEYSFTRGLSGATITATVGSLEARGLVHEGSLTTDGQRLRDDIEAATDQTQSALIAALGDDVEAVIDGADAISTAIVAAPAFPTDPRKRAAG